MNNSTLTVKEITVPLVTHRFKTEEGVSLFTVYSDGRWKCDAGKRSLEHDVYMFWEMIANKNPYYLESQLKDLKASLNMFLNGELTINQLKLAITSF